MPKKDPPDKKTAPNTRLTPVEVPYTRLTPEVLRALIEEFVTREGTDYGLREKTIDEKVEDVMRQIERGEVKIMFDLESQTANIVPAR
jgi:uncharacterized protein YheU (UPF0270 family)